MQNIHSFLNTLNSFYNNLTAEISITNHSKQYFDVEATKIEINNISTINQYDEVTAKIKNVVEGMQPAMIKNLEIVNKAELYIWAKLVFPEGNNEEERETYIQFCNEKLSALKNIREKVISIYESYVKQVSLLRRLIKKKRKEIILN